MANITDFISSEEVDGLVAFMTHSSSLIWTEFLAMGGECGTDGWLDLILTGSIADGTGDCWSDYDVLIVMDNTLDNCMICTPEIRRNRNRMLKCVCYGEQPYWHQACTEPDGRSWPIGCTTGPLQRFVDVLFVDSPRIIDRPVEYGSLRIGFSLLDGREFITREDLVWPE